MTCQTVVGVWHRGGGGMRWVRESSWDARLEHGAPSGTAPQFSPKFSRLCFHPSLTQNTELPGWQSRVCFPPPRAECWTWYAIPTGAAFDDAKRVTLLRFWIWRRICPVISLCHVIQQTCPGSKSCHVDLNSTQQKKNLKRIIWRAKYPEADDTLAHCLVSFWCTLRYRKALKSDIVTVGARAGKLGAFVQMVLLHFEGMGAKVF